ncbi:MAG: N-acetylmuramoyl-L-alanine amidase [Scytonematopsis contorta HA4267-MV1]|jgi:N-acetylmuramoyl-L-alanine amidase|nr:N-acetylmuramoyl-L-alanine amidase [Scytonematopsis contorta HA4267-MV1]
MRYGIDIGHNCPPDTGARGLKFEDNLTVDVGNRVITKLKALGNEVIECKPSKADTVRDSLSRRVNRAKSADVDVYVSLHFNAFNGQANGTEIFAISENSRKIAKTVLDEIVKLGFFNRGVKRGSHLFVLRNADMTAILVECCFCDSRKDMDLFDSEKMANAIVKGLTGKLPTEEVKPLPDEEDNVDMSTLRLQTALNRLKMADKNGKPLQEDGKLDPETIFATERFQKIMGLQVTSVAGNTTWNAINMILAKRVIRPNHAGGPIVRYIQHRMGAEVDGVYGPQTEVAVRRFQRQNGLLVDGIIGSRSWQILIG